MSDDKPDRVVSGEIVSEEEQLGTRGALDLHLRQPPDAETVPLSTALLQQYRYWGVRRTLDTYRKAIESGVGALRVTEEFYKAARDVDVEKARWGNRAQYRDAARLEADALIVRAQAEIEDAKVRKARSELELRGLQRQLAAATIMEEIEENNRAADLARAKRLRREEERRLEGGHGGHGGKKPNDFSAKRAAIQQARADYEELMAEKAKDVDKYGGEDNLPDWVVSMYETLEDDLGFRFE